MNLRRQSNGEILSLNTDKPLGTGGEAHVFEVVSEPQWAAKVYHKPSELKARKLAVMVAHPPNDPARQRNQISMAWPIDLLTPENAPERVVGYLMPRIQQTRPILHYYNPMTRRNETPLFSYLLLHRTARNLVSVVHALHESGYVVGDLNQSNILVTETGLVTLVDTDSFQVRDPENGTLYRCPVGRPEYTPAELQRQSFAEQDRTPESDYFGLAVLLFQLLMEGTHPFAGVYAGEDEPPPYEVRIQAGHFPYGDDPNTPYRPLPAAPAYSTVYTTLRTLFGRCFTAGHLDPKARPNTATWMAALKEAEQSLQVCTVNDQHYYGDDLPHCPWCARAARLGGRDPFPSKWSVKSGEYLHTRSRQAATPKPSPVATPSAMPSPPSMPAVVSAAPRPEFTASRPNLSGGFPLSLTGVAAANSTQAATASGAAPLPFRLESNDSGVMLRESTAAQPDSETAKPPVRRERIEQARAAGGFLAPALLGLFVIVVLGGLYTFFTAPEGGTAPPPMPASVHTSGAARTSSAPRATPVTVAGSEPPRQSILAIEQAAKNGDTATVTRLLTQYPTLVTTRNKDAWTPLHYAAYYSRPLVATALLDGGADVNATEKDGFTPLHLAAQEGHLEVAEMLMSHQANVNVKENMGWTPLHFATQEGHTSLVEVLLAHGADVNARDNSGLTPLAVANKENRTDIAAILREHGGS